MRKERRHGAYGDAGSTPVLGTRKFNEMSKGSYIATVLTDIPVTFRIGESRPFYLYPQTIGRMYLTANLCETLAVDKENLKLNPYLEALRLAEQKKKECCMLIAYHTFHSKRDMLSPEQIEKRTATLMSIADNEDIASLLISILTNSKVENIMEEEGVFEEEKRMRKVMKAKDDRSSIVFGGKTIWGNIIDAACERYGWTFDYVVWHISFANLTLMMKDKVTTIYLTEKERKKCGVANKADIVNGDDKAVMIDLIKSGKLG